MIRQTRTAPSNIPSSGPSAALAAPPEGRRRPEPVPLGRSGTAIGKPALTMSTRPEIRTAPTAASPPPKVPSTATSAGALTTEFLAALRDGYRMTTADRACQNAATNNALSTLAVNRGIVRGDDGHFSHRVKSRGVTNQGKSGRCWMFAGLNVLRPQVIRDFGMEEFQFSTAYLQFWDKIEKANLFLESIIELRDVDFLDRDWEMVNKGALEDGGWWNYLVALIDKYGLAPRAAMPETHASTHTETLNHVLGRFLRSRAVRIIGRHEGGGDLPELRAEKEQAIRDVYRLLVINLGEPPDEFEWRYRRKRKRPASGEPDEEDMHRVADEALTPVERHTPHSFRDKYVGASLADHVCLYNDPQNEFDRRYRFDRARNIVGTECMDFVNVDTATMKQIAKSSILANEPLWFAVNMFFDQSEELGLMEHQLFDYETLFGIDLEVSKADRTRFHAGASGHAMALMGVDLAADGQPRKWLVENSWGEKRGDKGLWTLHDRWFDEHVYTIIVHKRHVPDQVMKCFEQEPVLLPAWYPGAHGIRC